MLILAIKTLIVLLAVASTPTMFSDTTMFIFLLLSISITAFNQYYHIKNLTLILVGCYILISLFYPPAIVFLPILLFDTATHLSYKYTLFFPLIFIIISSEDTSKTFFHILIGLTALLLSHMFTHTTELDRINKETRDINASQKITLMSKNQKPLERQNDEIHLTKLKERNRIARDIHDTIGHSLSRALLQTGALHAMNQDSTIKPAIEALKETLTSSMNSIRNSIHDLKDDSIDLKLAISQILLESNFETSFNYDVDNEVSNAIKNCFLIVLKESLTNTRKHSDATSVAVTVAEHPAIYQFLIIDNGSKAPTSSEDGIGLKNINERINELSGYCRINYQDGFKIFITIPKKELDPNENYNN